MFRNPIAIILAALVGAVLGYVLGSADGHDSIDSKPAEPRGRPGSPVLESSALRDLRIANLESALRERDAQISALLERLASADGHEPATQPTDSPVDAARQRTHRHFLTDPALSASELAERARVATSYTGQFQQFVVALHERDVATYLDAVWAARSQVARKEGVELSREEDLALMEVFRASWLELRAWARSDYMRAVDAAQSLAELQALDAEWATKVSMVYSGLNQRARRVLPSQERFDQVSRFL